MIAIPDFEAGAMENWGLIIYRETLMLFKEGYSSEKNKEEIAKTIAHELGHMVCPIFLRVPTKFFHDSQDKFNFQPSSPLNAYTSTVVFWL